MINLLANTTSQPSALLCCAVASDIVLFKGSKGLTQDAIDRTWKYSPYPPTVRYLRRVSVKNLKWYINNYVEVNDPIWNSDFIHGLSTFGRVQWSSMRFPAFYWNHNKAIFEILKSSPFYGELTDGDSQFYSWHGAPAFYVKYDEKSISFMAGVLATGKIESIGGETYIKYSKYITKYLEQWGIPIERRSPNEKFSYISPLWSALFTKFMPESRSDLLDIKNGGCKSNLYATIIWRMYISNYIKRNGIPFLKSRRWVYNHLGAKDNSEEDWLKLGLSQLDKRIRSVVMSWEKDVKDIF